MLISETALKAIRQHAQKTYPQECVGLLAGTFEDGGQVAASYQADNLAEERDRYFLDPVYFVKMEEQLEDQGLEIVGFYHSHPDDTAHFSETDLQYAWEDYFYLVVSVREGTAGEVRAWIVALDPDDPNPDLMDRKKILREEKLEVGS